MTKLLIFQIFNLFLMINQFMMIMLLMLPMKKNKFHPINLMMILILLTIMLIMKMNYLLKSWIPFILFLIMIGGLMIILMYIISLINNNLLHMKFFDLTLISFKIVMTLMFLMLTMKSNFFYFNEMIFNLNIFNKYMFNMNNLFNYNLNFTFFLMNYLFLSMMCIMNICNKYKSPIRQLYLYE